MIFGAAPTLGQVLYDVQRLNNFTKWEGTVVNVVPGRSGTLSNLQIFYIFQILIQQPKHY